MLDKLLKKYDSYLGCKKNLDGSISIFRKSPYTTMKFDILTLENQYIGSSGWVLKKIAMMDSRRKDFFTSAIAKNQKLKQKSTDKRMSHELADYMLNGGMTIIT